MRMPEIAIFAALALVVLFPGAVRSSTDGLDLMNVRVGGSFRSTVAVEPGTTAGRSIHLDGRRWNPPGCIDKAGCKVYRARPDQTLRDIAEKVYGDRRLWPLIFKANPGLMNRPAFAGKSGAVDLVIPPPPSQRVFRYKGELYFRALPGDTLKSAARALYGNEDYWTLLYFANRNRFCSPLSSSSVISNGGVGDLVFSMPRPGSTPKNVKSLPDFPDKVLWSSVPSDYYKPLKRDGHVSYVTPSPDRMLGLRASGKAIFSLKLSGPGDISGREAVIILRDTGYLCRRNPTYEKALKALSRGYYRGSGNGRLDRRSRERLYEQYKWYTEAVARYSDYPTISSTATPGLYSRWVSEAASLLDAVPAYKREALLRSLMSTESSQTQWKDFKPVISNCGAVGFGQFLPATAKGLGINPYDPGQNIKAIAVYLNKLIKRHGLRKGIAAYNGGGNPPAASYRYADRILSRAGMR